MYCDYVCRPGLTYQGSRAKSGCPPVFFTTPVSSSGHHAFPDVIVLRLCPMAWRKCLETKAHGSPWEMSCTVPFCPSDQNQPAGVCHCHLKLLHSSCFFKPGEYRQPSYRANRVKSAFFSVHGSCKDIQFAVLNELISYSPKLRSSPARLQRWRDWLCHFDDSFNFQLHEGNAQVQGKGEMQILTQELKHHKQFQQHL